MQKLGQARAQGLLLSWCRGGPAKGKQPCEKAWFFSRIFPDDDETRAIVDEINAKSPIEILWEQIVIQYTAIARAQKIMFVRDQDDKSIERVGYKKGKVIGEDWEVQQAWDKHGNFLQAQSRAMKTLESLIEKYEKLLTRDLDLEEQRLWIEKLKVEVERLKNPGEADLQAYTDALKAVGEALQEELQRIQDEADAAMLQMYKAPIPKKDESGAGGA